MYVLGTAGHVDHGKSTLVQALTGIDPDRLAEEKDRGLTIDLGFAWLRLPSGKEVSIVDVPGHERFVKNMLAGVGGIDLALLVIAADEGVMPQTREHLAILDLLNIERGLVAITKKDLVDDEMLELVTLDAEEVLQATALEGAPMVVTSATTREGLDELLSVIDRLLESAPPRRDIGKPRLAIDRVFTMKGFGTVVTGTLIDGKLSIGQQVEVLPRGLKSSIRGLQTHRRGIDAAMPGTRVAVNLASVAVDELQRGMVVTTPGWLTPSRFLDVKLRAIPDLAQPITHNKSITFHTGSAEATGRLRLLDKETVNRGESGWAQIVLSQPVAAARDDLFIIRSSTGTIGGGKIVDTRPRRHRRFDANVIETLESREKGSPEDIVLGTLEANEPAELSTVLSLSSLSTEEARNTLQTLVSEGRAIRLGDGSRALLFSLSGWNRLRSTAQRALEVYHTQFPLRTGMPKEEFRGRLRLPASAFGSALDRMIGDGTVIEERGLVRLPAHEVTLTPKQKQAVETFLRTLAQTPFSPPGDSLPEPEILNMLAETQQVIKVSENVIFSKPAYDEMVRRISDHIKTSGKITVAEVRDMFQTSRKYALALLEYLDEQKITRRVGDERVLR